MKKVLVSLLVILFSSTILLAEENKLRPSISLDIGFKILKTDYSFSHDTHKEDNFMQNWKVPGSAGITSIDWMPAVSMGPKVQLPIGDLCTLDLGGGVIASGRLSRKEHQNVNDTRSEDEGSFVYSKVRYGLYASAGLSVYPTSDKRFYFGADFNASKLKFESGWDRFNSDESQFSSDKNYTGVGPKVGYIFGQERKHGFEISSQLKKDSYGITVGFRYIF